MGRTIVLNAPRPGVEPGSHLTELFRANGRGTRMLLAKRSQWLLESAVQLTDDDQELATEGYPVDDADKAVIRIVGKQAGAIGMGGLKRTRLRNLFVDGNELKLGRADPAGALVFMAGPGSEDQLLENCVIQHTRGWTCCHVFDHGLRPRVMNNRVGPSGYGASGGGPWADGLSVACRDGIIAGNTIIDATDGGIVVFCAPGTVVVNNTIIARERELLGGINLVDFGPYEGDYRNTRVVSNRVISEGAFIRLGIGIGSRPWGDGNGIGAYGGSVYDNVFGPGTFGYASAIGGARDMIVSGNRIAPGTVFEGNAKPGNPAAQAFIKYAVPPEETLGEVQEDFVAGFFAHLIGITPGLATSKKFYAGGFSLSVGESIKLKKARLELQREGRLVLWDEQAHGRVLWSTPRPNTPAREPIVKLNASGVLEIRDTVDDRVVWASTYDQLPKSHRALVTTDASFTISDMPPHLLIGNAAEDLVYVSTPRIFPRDALRMSSGHFIALSNPGGTPAWAVMDPKTSALVLHLCPEPLQIQKDFIVWRTPNWTDVEWDGDPNHASVLAFQGDSNVVIYAHGKGAIYATGTNGGEDLPYIAFFGPEEPGGMRVELLAQDYRPRWSSVQQK